MGKKCIPGIICIENMTLFLLTMIFIVVVYLYYKQYAHDNPSGNTYIVLPNQNQNQAQNLSQSNTINNPYVPPVKDGTYFRSDSGDPRGLPVNIKTRAVNDSYQQMGILTRKNDELILPLMGRQLTAGNYHWQYYTMTTTGNMNTKLPISINGKSCTGEYGCDSLSNGDIVYVEGYSDTFRVTLYENSTFNYIPYF
uniref:Uncharacterized protein n=1 Tax=viral metagenome TaxID=1070528 RepID=A0A6C0B7C2_9ZZZZ